MRYLLYTCLLVLLMPAIAPGQQNLVPNGDFEYYTNCPQSAAGSIAVNFAQPGWKNYRGSPDYLHTCAPTISAAPASVPSSVFGYQYPVSGNGYCGFAAYTNSINGAANFEYITSIMNSMQPGVTYEVSISVSRADDYRYATNNIGVYFFDSGVTQTGNGSILPIIPQVHYSNYGVITDTQNWIRLVQNYTADSFYDNIVVGPFNDNSNSYILDTVSVTGWTAAYYFVDSVVVRTLDSFYVLFSKKTICVNDTFSLNYISTVKRNQNNIFTAQLSNASGDFSNPVVIGTKASDTSGTILCTIPSNILPGAGYRLRVVSSNNVDSSKNNGYGIRIDTLIPAITTIFSNSPVCEGDTLFLGATTATQGVIWKWNGPSGFTSSIDSPFRINMRQQDSGMYIVRPQYYACIGQPDTVQVIVNDTLTKITANSNNLFCEPDTLYLTASNTTPSGATYSWTGPNNFTSNQQNPVLPSTTSAASGSYIVTADRLGCKVADTVTVTVKPLPTFTATSNTPLCTGSNLQLGVNSSFTGVSYSWAGPSGFNASTPNPFINNVIVTNSGEYIATATLNDCSFKDTATVLVKPLPAKPVAANNSPFCQGDTVYLTSVSATNGVSYSWSGPGSFSDTAQNPFVYPASSSVSGDYIVTVTKDGCISTDTTTVTVKPRPDTITVSNNSPLCHGDTLKLFSDSSSAGVSYTWTGPGSFSSAANDTIITNAAPSASGWYRMMVDLNGCTYSDSTYATIHPIPSAPLLSYNNPLCLGETLNLSAGTVPSGTYSWSGPGSFNASAQNPNRANMQYNDTGRYYATVTVNGCTSPQDSIRVAINPLPFVVITANPSDSVCQGDPATFTAYPNNHGGTPQYIWYINNQLAGTNSVLITTTLNDQDVILCRMTETTKCAAPYTDESNDITMTVLPWLAPSVSITANPNRPLKPWEYVTFTATATNAGNNPGYQWKRNGADVVGATGSVWSANTLNDNDSISVVITSNYKCPQPPTAVSNGITVQVLTGIGSINTSAITLYPNPNTGRFVLEGSILYKGSVQLEISNALGQVVYTGELVTENNALRKEMELNHPNPGIYFLKIKTADGTGMIRFTVR